MACVSCIDQFTTPSWLRVAAIWQMPPITRDLPKAVSSVSMCDISFRSGTTQVVAAMAGRMASMLADFYSVYLENGISGAKKLLAAAGKIRK